MAIAEVVTTYRAVYWIEGQEQSKCEVYLTRQGNNKFIQRNSEHAVLCADVNLAIRKGKVSGEVTEPTQGGTIVYQWYLYNVQANARF